MKTPYDPSSRSQGNWCTQGRASPPEPRRVTAQGRCCHCKRSCVGPGKAGQPSSDRPCWGTAGTCDMPVSPISRLSERLSELLIAREQAPGLLVPVSCPENRAPPCHQLPPGLIVTDQWGRAEHPGGARHQGRLPSPRGTQREAKILPTVRLGVGKLLSSSAHLLGYNSPSPSCSLQVGKREKEPPPSSSSHGMPSFLFLTSSWSSTECRVWEVKGQDMQD